MSLTSALGAALSGQQLQSGKLDVVQRNMNSVDIEGARKKVAVASTVVVGGKNLGVEIAQVKRDVNMAYVKTAQELTTNLHAAEIDDDILTRVTQIFGSPKSQSSVGNLIANFESSVEALSRDAADGALQFKTVKTAATRLTDAFNENEKAVQGFREEVEGQISEKIAVFNNNLEQLAVINKQIDSLSTYSNDYTDLLDTRDQLLKEIRAISGANYFINDSDSAVVMAGDGSFDFLNRNVKEIDFIAAGKGSLSSGMTYENGGVNGITITTSAGVKEDITKTFKSGELHALLKLRDETLPNLSEQLHQLAGGVKDTVNKAHAPGTSIPPLTEMVSEDGITATDFTLQTVNDPASIRLVPGTGGTYGTIEFAILDRQGQAVGTACQIDLDQLKADIETYHLPTVINYELTQQDIMNAVNGYYAHPPANVPPAGAQPSGWTGAWPIGAPMANNYPGLQDTSGQNGPYTNGEFMRFDANDRLTFGVSDTASHGVAINEAGVNFSFDGFKDQDPGFSYPMGINNLFVTDALSSDARGIRVRDDIQADPSRLSRGVLKSRVPDPVGAPTVSEWYVGSADNAILRNISTGLEQTLSFTAGGLNVSSASLEQFANAILVNASTMADEARTNKLYYEELSTQIETVISEQSDPNIDKELMDSVPIKAQYAAMMNMIRTIQQMLDELMNAFR